MPFRQVLLNLSSLLVTILFLTNCKFNYAKSKNEKGLDEASQQLIELQHLNPEELTTTAKYEIKNGSSAFETLTAAGISPTIAQKLIDQSANVYSLGKVRAGTPVKVIRNKQSGSLQRVEVIFSPVESLAARFLESTGNWDVELVKNPIETELVTFSGVVETSLWESGLTSHMDALLISDFADIFAWQIDFSREVKSGDKWRISVEKKTVNGVFYEWGPILVAEYKQSSGNVLTGVRFPREGKVASYYDLDGASLKRLFLKAPIQYARITSGFSKRRFHPILKFNRPHNGVDYGAKPGTPVMAVGQGEVVAAAFNQETGNMVKIRHNSVYETVYMHLQGFGSGIRKGTKVDQSQVIGYVGSTGLATGPHLHFGFFEHGRYVDPLGIKFPSAEPISEAAMADFKRLAQEVLVSLPDWRLADNKPPENATPQNL